MSSSFVYKAIELNNSTRPMKNGEVKRKRGYLWHTSIYCKKEFMAMNFDMKMFYI